MTKRRILVLALVVAAVGVLVVVRVVDRGPSRTTLSLTTFQHAPPADAGPGRPSAVATSDHTAPERFTP